MLTLGSPIWTLTWATARDIGDSSNIDAISAWRIFGSPLRDPRERQGAGDETSTPAPVLFGFRA
jgi:hypothetical protein